MTSVLSFSVLILISQILHRAKTQKCSALQGSEVSIFGRKLQGHVYKTMMADLGLGCLLVCRTDDRCQSFNFVMSLHMCEFSDRTKDARPEDFTVDLDRYYFKRDMNRVPLGSIPELAAESCKEIKASEGEAVSGKYWLSSIKPGRAVLAYCDMKTEDVNECTASSPVCDVNAICNNTLGSYRCTCKPGYAGDGKTCKDINECSSSPSVCDVNADCQNQEGSYVCSCRLGFCGDGNKCKRVLGLDCQDIKNKNQSANDGMYWLDPDGGSHSNAFQAYCDMTSYDGGWTMCYTTDEYVIPRTEVTYDLNLPYGTNGYRMNCTDIQFKEIIFVDHQTGNKTYFKRKSNVSMKAADNYGKSADSYGLWDGFGSMNSAYSYQLLICNTAFYRGFFVSGYTGQCYKSCGSWCGDTTSPYFRTSTTSGSNFKGVAFNINGHLVLNKRLMSVGLR